MKFKVGDQVKHLGKLATVTAVFTSHLGYRYYVLHSGFIWSAPEEALKSIEKRQ